MNVRRLGARVALTIAGVAGVAVILAFALSGALWPAGGPARAVSGECGTSDNLIEWNAAVVTLTPDSGPLGASFAVEVTNFALNPAGQPIEILWNFDPDAGERALVGSGTIPPDQDSVTVAAVVPEYAEPGAQWVTACWYREASDTWFYKKAAFEVVEPTPTPTPTPTATPEATPTPLPTATPPPTSGQVLNCPPANKWAIAVWDGPGTGVGEALGACGEGAIDSAYYIDPDSQLWLRYLAGRPDLSNLEALDNMQGVIAHGSGEPNPSAAPTPGEGEMHNCPLPGKWSIAVWDGVDIDTSGALSNCAEEIDFAYHLEPEGQLWRRWFAGLPEISNFETVNGGQGLIAHGKATLPTLLGRIAFISNRDANDLEIYAVNSDGTGLTNLTKNKGADDSPAWSPDGSKLAFRSYRDGNSEIYVMNADGTGQTRLTTDTADDEQPVWSPDGSRIAFVSRRSGGSEIWVMNADGSGQTKLTWWPSGGPTAPSWSPDGSKIAFESWSDIYVADAVAAGQPVPVATNLTNSPSPISEIEPAWSPDGAKIAFRCCDDDNWEIYVMNADGTSPTNLSNSPGWDTDQAWAPDGIQIAFSSDRDGNAEIYVVKPDGTSLTRVTSTSGDHEYDASWAPGSSRVAVECTISTNVEVCVVDANGVTNVSNHPWVDMDPAWSP